MGCSRLACATAIAMACFSASAGPPPIHPIAHLPALASANGAYADLLQVVHCLPQASDDLEQFGDFRNGGFWSGGTWCGQEGKPGFWVWLNPDWYVWKKRRSKASHAPPPFVVPGNTQLPQHWFASGHDWLALVCTDKICALEPASLTTEDRPWHTMKHGTLKGQNLAFQFDNPAVQGSPVVYFHIARPMPWLRPGPIPVYRHEAAASENGWQVALPDGTTSQLQAQPDTASRPGLPFTYPLQIRQGQRKQWLSMAFGECSTIGNDWLLWAGDLDGDGKPDYLVNLMDEEPIVLLLSSEAKPGELVGIYGTYGLEEYHEADCG